MLEQAIKERIIKNGPMTFCDFMRMSLYDHVLGYYAKDTTDIGINGDFFTSPHLHPSFGAMIGVQMEEMWDALDRPEIFTIVEQGAGRGFLACDMLDYLKGSPLYSHVQYRIIEMNPHMRLRQAELLAPHSNKISWDESLQKIGIISGCIVSNELLDAMPVHLIEMYDELKELYIGLNNDEFEFHAGQLSNTEIRKYFDLNKIHLPKGYRTEICTDAKDWIKQAASAISKGFILTIDYGYGNGKYFAEYRDRGTIMCYYRHSAIEDPLINIGMQDITAHVNFSALKIWGDECGLQCIGYCPQGAYLVSLGIVQYLETAFGNSPQYAFHANKIKGLILPTGMGESHKVLVQSKGNSRPVRKGFEMKNRLSRL